MPGYRCQSETWHFFICEPALRTRIANRHSAVQITPRRVRASAACSPPLKRRFCLGLWEAPKNSVGSQAAPKVARAVVSMASPLCPSLSSASWPLALLRLDCPFWPLPRGEFAPIIVTDNRELNERFRQEQPGAQLLQPSPVSVAPFNMIIVYSSVRELRSQAHASGNTGGRPRGSRTSCPHVPTHGPTHMCPHRRTPMPDATRTDRLPVTCACAVEKWIVREDQKP